MCTGGDLMNLQPTEIKEDFPFSTFKYVLLQPIPAAAYHRDVALAPR